ncbi:MFS transporter [Novosphingobium sp. KACC 22771]|uniref:MFS transporter n=1 Tax=Novosphingobium sp. KACC 22771 TaxID=3025670 RepID=UPI002365672C|nr:glycoside-pentoside-hexuronide (GPH):cation symporter [Novosphingobium sp. KACC 22771]WDF75044.1 glycoside-pentoside-hexuronide (GPH):cation symporter [Novosphingobium sp. KACC 22771]
MQETKLSFVERLSYGFGDMGTSLAYNMASGFLLFYYTNVVGLPAASVGTVFLIARLLDAVIDVLVGIAVDKTRSRWGRTRIYFLFVAVPYALVSVAVFHVPAWGQSAQLVYAFITFKALGIFMSFQAIPYTALMPMMTLDGGERLKLSGMRSIGTSVSVVLGTATVMPLVGALGGGDQQRGFTLVAALFAAIGFACTAALFRHCRERHEDHAAPDFAILPAVGEMLRNRAWLVVFGSCLLYFARFGMMMAATAYFAIDVLGRPWMISVMLPAVAGMLLLSAFVAPAILARTGIRNGTVGALALAAVLFAALPFVQDHVGLFLGLYIGGCLATSITITAAFAMVAETVDYHEAQFGTRREGLLSAGISLSTKLGMALGTAGFAYVLGASGYVPGHVSEGAREAIRWTYSGGAVALLAAQTLVMLFWPIGARGKTPTHAALSPQ